MSPSSRRAWVEIWSVLHQTNILGSPSSRRAWVEIAACLLFCVPTLDVALLAEGVGRNRSIAHGIDMMVGRPPRGGRG